MVRTHHLSAPVDCIKAAYLLTKQTSNQKSPSNLSRRINTCTRVSMNRVNPPWVRKSPIKHIPIQASGTKSRNTSLIEGKKQPGGLTRWWTVSPALHHTHTPNKSHTHIHTHTHARTHARTHAHTILFFFRRVSIFNILKTLTLQVHAGLFWCFHNPPNSDMDYRVLSLACQCELVTCVYTRRPRLNSLYRRTFNR